MTTDEVLSFADSVLGGDGSDLSYDDLVRVITKCTYVFDVCLAEIDRRGEFTYLDGGIPIVPDALPESLFVETPLTRGQDPIAIN